MFIKLNAFSFLEQSWFISGWQRLDAICSSWWFKAKYQNHQHHRQWICVRTGKGGITSNCISESGPRKQFRAFSLEVNAFFFSPLENHLFIQQIFGSTTHPPGTMHPPGIQWWARQSCSLSSLSLQSRGGDRVKQVVVVLCNRSKDGRNRVQQEQVGWFPRPRKSRKSS